MSIDEPSTPARASELTLRPSSRLRIDLPDAEERSGVLNLVVAFAAAAVGFVVVGGGSLDLGPAEAKLGLSAVEPLGPFGQSLGGWEPGVWVGSVLPSRAWATVGGMWDAAIVRWPGAIAGIVVGLFLARAMKAALGVRAACLATLCWFGGVALVDRSADAGVDLIAGLGTILALNRLLTRGSGWVAGGLASWAFLAGGWPPLAVIGLAALVLGRAGASISYKTVVPVAVTVAGWSAWALATTRAQVWAAAMSLPLTQGSAWSMAVGVLGLGFPWSPFALLGIAPRVRDGWATTGRPFAVGWGQVALACLVVGTVVPGLATAARMPALAGLAIVAAASWDSILAGSLSDATASRRWLHGLSFAVVALWAAGMLVWGGRLALAVGYYRPVAILLIALAVGAATLTLVAAWSGDCRGTLGAIVLVAISLKLAHWGHHVPEWNYRHGQGPWGRAIGQWVPRKRTVYVLHGWPSDLIFAAERPFRALADPRLLPDRPGPSPKFILLQQSEFDHWLDKWPKILPVARFQDEWGGGRVLARTEGPFSWREAAIADRLSD